MSTLQIVKTDQITVWVHVEKKIIHHQMHQFTSGETLQNALMAGIAGMKKYRAYKWLSDDRKNPVISPEDQQWTASVWRPLAIQSGWKYWAIVIPETTLNQIRMKKIAETNSKLGVTVEFFHDPQKAMEWLEKQ
jgi:hypothetical protein